LANHGQTPAEIAEEVKFPDELDRHWAMRGYYGSVNHNVRATYVNYLGWFDGNPANLYTLPPEEAAKRYVDIIGGAEVLLEKARRAFDQGDYRWVAEVVNHAVFADPDNQDAKNLQADALEQLGYQSESGPWRNFYLTAAKELRDGVMVVPTPNAASADSVRSMSPELFFDYLGVRLNGGKAGGKKITINARFPDLDANYTLMVRNGALTHRNGAHDTPDVSVTIDRSQFNDVILGQTTLPDQISAGTAQVDGNVDALHEFIGLLDTFEFWFNIVTP
jgi:alkyl sulfatase BDS1-like metallo-beta-lactamase superfamily hydrolase